MSDNLSAIWQRINGIIRGTQGSRNLLRCDSEQFEIEAADPLEGVSYRNDYSITLDWNYRGPIEFEPELMGASNQELKLVLVRTKEFLNEACDFANRLHVQALAIEQSLREKLNVKDVYENHDQNRDEYADYQKLAIYICEKAIGLTKGPFRNTFAGTDGETGMTFSNLETDSKLWHGHQDSVEMCKGLVRTEILKPELQPFKIALETIRGEAQEISGEIQKFLPMGRGLTDVDFAFGGQVYDVGASATKRPIEYDFRNVFTDSELISRCTDLVNRGEHFDRVVREATTILENRIREKSGISDQIGVKLVNLVFQKPSGAILVVSEDGGEQEGFQHICRGVMLLFRDAVHHDLTDALTEREVLKVCGLIDTLLAKIDKARVAVVEKKEAV